jgi:hypothetical protein
VDLPLQGSEVVATAVEHRRPYRGPIQPSTNTALLRHVGGPTPGEVLVLPMVVHGSVAMVFYGDDAARSGGIGATRALEFLILETGLEMEKADVEERMRQLRAAQGR